VKSLPTPSLTVQNKFEIQDKGGKNFIIFITSNQKFQIFEESYRKRARILAFFKKLQFWS